MVLKDFMEEGRCGQELRMSSIWMGRVTGTIDGKSMSS